jgi:peptidoglycan hydrolase-like protein with peptidoglycan-binding domain
MRRKLLIAGAVTMVLAGALTGVIVARGPAAKDRAANPALPPATAKVIKTTLVETKTVAGTLGYGDPAPISATGTGTLTWIASVGVTVRRGEPLFKIDERPVVALYGSVPLYRILRDGASGGADVHQLEKNLAELGYIGFTVDETYTSATAAAVRRWKADLGVPQTGIVEPGQVVFTPGPIRIAEHGARVGDVLGGGSSDRFDGGRSVLSYTGTTRLVTIDLKVADQALAVRGRTVTVTVPSRNAVEGKIAQVGTIATAPEQAGAAPDTTSSAASDASIKVCVTIADQAALGPLRAAPVDVDFVSEQRKNVLAVPVAALLALTNGGYGVEIVSGDTTRIVAVKTGMFAAGRVEVSGDTIAEGVTVGVAQ